MAGEFSSGQPDWTPPNSSQFLTIQQAGNDVSLNPDWIWAHVLTGSVYFHDDFEGTTLRWHASSEGAALAPVLDTTYAHRGDRSLKCATAAAALNDSFAYRYFRFPPSAKFGAGGWFSVENAVNAAGIRVAMPLGGVTYDTGVMWDASTGEVLVGPDAGSTTVVGSATLEAVANDNFVLISLVVNTATRKVEKVRFMGNEYNVSVDFRELFGDANSPYVRLEVACKNLHAGAEVVRWDDVYLTYNEV